MPSYALVNTSGAILRRDTFADTAPVLAVAKGLRWLSDTPPAFDSVRQLAVASVPVAIDATQIAYTIVTSPAYVASVAAANARALVVRRATKLAKDGDKIGSLTLLIQKGIAP